MAHVVGLLFNAVMHEHLESAYENARRRNVYMNAEMISSPSEYWAIGSEIWFGVEPVERAGPICNKFLLERNDLGLCELLESVYNATKLNCFNYLDFINAK